MATTLTLGALSSSSSHHHFPFSNKSQPFSSLSKCTSSSPSFVHRSTKLPSMAALESKIQKGGDVFSVLKDIFKRMPQYALIEESLVQWLHRIPLSKTHAKDLRYLDNHGSKKSLESITFDHNSVDKSPKSTGFIDRYHRGGDISYVYSGLRMMLIAGLLIFQGSEQAFADTEFTGGIRPLSYLGDLGDISTGFASAFLLIFFSELGDKTFFIAALLAARNSGAVVFIGTFGALAAMSVISVVLGRSFHYLDGILPFSIGETDLPLDDLAAVCLLVYFGVTTLLDASSSDSLKMNEEQKEAELAVSELSANGAGIMAAASTVISTFLLVFVAEWGDKSFFSTIALAAASSPLGVIAGAFAGHGLATLLAVIGGSLLGSYFSEKVIAYIGGVLFLVFAVVTLIESVS